MPLFQRRRPKNQKDLTRRYGPDVTPDVIWHQERGGGFPFIYDKQKDLLYIGDKGEIHGGMAEDPALDDFWNDHSDDQDTSVNDNYLYGRITGDKSLVSFWGSIALDSEKVIDCIFKMIQSRVLRKDGFVHFAGGSTSGAIPLARLFFDMEANSSLAKPSFVEPIDTSDFRFYKEPNGDYLVIDVYSVRAPYADNTNVEYEGRATAIGGNVNSIATTSIGEEHLDRCVEVNPDEVPSLWFVRLIGEE